MDKLEFKRKVVVLIFIGLIFSQVLLLGFLGDRITRSQLHAERLTEEASKLHKLRTDTLLAAQSNELLYLSETWNNWKWGSKPRTEVEPKAGEWQLVFSQFVERMIVGRQGVDGSRITLVLNGQGETVYKGAGVNGDTQSLAAQALVDTNILFPNVLQLEGISWNRIAVPSPTSSAPRLIIFYGFDEEAVCKENLYHLTMVQHHATEIHRTSSLMFWIVGAMMFVIVILGMAISINLREAEYEMKRKQNYCLGQHKTSFEA